MDPFDPTGSGQILAAVLTAAGVPIAGAIIAAITQALKSIPGFGSWIEAGHEVVVTMIVSAALVGYAAVATNVALDLISGFGLFLAWLALNGFSKVTYDTVKSTTSSGG